MSSPFARAASTLHAYDFAPWAWTVAIGTLLALGTMAVVSWLGHHPAMGAARTAAMLRGMPAPGALPVPVEDVGPGRIADTFGAPRGKDRSHQGVDIFADRGTPVLSTTEGLVVAVRDQGLGGRQVWVLGPGHERHYYAHLDEWALGLRAGDRVRPGTPLGTVGDTGNARGTPPHLHYGIYTATGPVDPLPRLRNAAPAD